MAAIPSPSYSITLRLEAPVGPRTTTDLVSTVGETGAAVTAVDVVEATDESMVVDVSANARDEAHVGELRSALEEIAGVAVRHISDATFLKHPGGQPEARTEG